MRYQINKWTLNLIFVLAAVSGGALKAQAVTVFAGSVSGTQVTDWRTGTTTKTFDIDGDNVYGSSLGAVHWQLASSGQQSSGSSTLGWAFINSDFQVKKPEYVSIDSIINAPANDTAGIALATFDFELTGTAADYTNKTVRVGIMADVLSSGEWTADTFKGYRIVQTVGGTSDSGVISLRSGAAGDGNPEMYFFDLTGVTAGNRFQIQALTNIGGTGTGQSGYMGPVSFDIATTPVPFEFSPSLGLVALGGIFGADKLRKKVGLSKSNKLLA